MKMIKKERNFRELGGYTNKEGKSVKYDCLFRSGNLNDLSENEKSCIAQLGIKDIVDFRSEEERTASSYKVFFDCEYHPIVALHTKDGLENFYFSMLIHENSTKEEVFDASEFVREGYKELPFHNKAYQKVFDLMLTSNHGILFHCSSGKDRTGLMAALILKALNVDEKTIMKDYLDSNQNVISGIVSHTDRLGFTGEVREALIYCCSVHEELLLSAYEEILKRYKSWDCYFKEEYNLDQEKIKFLKSKYLMDN